MQEIIRDIELFEADYGGTDIVNPLRAVHRWHYSPAPKKRIFILTDGCVPNQVEVIQAVKE